jgi:CRP-like cAMP-binding protein
MPRRNALIASIEPELWDHFQDRFRPFEFEEGRDLQRPGDDVDLVQFPTTALVVLGVETLAGERVNVALLGPEGAVGAFEACGSRKIYHCATVQFGGVVWQSSAATYRALYNSSHSLRTAVHKYIESLMFEARQYVACNALHGVENRLARTLLEACDKSGSLKLPITQLALAQLLGVQRTTVAAAMSSLQRGGSIRTDRGGGLEVLDYARLETAACGCRDSLAFARNDIQSRSVVICDG